MQTLLRPLRRPTAPPWSPTAEVPCADAPVTALAPLRAGGLEALVTRDPALVLLAQRLRHRVFGQAFGAHFDGDGIDRDRWDPWCDHLIVRTRERGDVVGTYRMLLPSQARLAGGLYTEQEFDLAELAPLRASLVELGRACIDPDHRGGTVLLLLWSALGEYLARQPFSHLIGCVSVPIDDGGVQAARLDRHLRAIGARSPLWQASPRNPLRLPADAAVDDDVEASMPPLMRCYLRGGGEVIGAPCVDAGFGCADFPMLLRASALSPRFARRLAPTATSG